MDINGSIIGAGDMPRSTWYNEFILSHHSISESHNLFVERFPSQTTELKERANNESNSKGYRTKEADNQSNAENNPSISIVHGRSYI